MSGTVLGTRFTELSDTLPRSSLFLVAGGGVMTMTRSHDGMKRLLQRCRKGSSVLPKRRARKEREKRSLNWVLKDE